MSEPLIKVHSDIKDSKLDSESRTEKSISEAKVEHEHPEQIRSTKVSSPMFENFPNKMPQNKSNSWRSTGFGSNFAFSGNQSTRHQPEHESNQNIMIKRRIHKGKKELTGALGFIANREEKGNHLAGQQWVDQQQKRNQYAYLKGGDAKKLSEDDQNHKVTYVQPSSAEKKLAKLKDEGKPFKDRNFPASQSSLFGGHNQDPNWGDMKWKKIEKVFPDGKIFVGKVEPCDIKQGFLGDCYFLAGLAAISERPDRIIDLFVTKKRNNLNYYSIKMLYKGKWRIVDLDDKIPTIYNKPAFANSSEKQLWVILMEKAWAKLYGSYKHIEAGFPEEPLHDLTGAPIKHIFLNRHNPKLEEENWKYLLEASEREYAMVASSNAGSDTQKSQSGVVQGHAYTFLNATYLNLGYSKDKIVQLRNPWGKGEFKGRWSDYDQGWNYVPQEEKDRIGWKDDKADGIFFMTYDDFQKEFRTITIAEIDDDASYIYKSYYDPEMRGAYFKVKIAREGEYSFQVDQTPERIFQGEKQERYRYPEVLIEVSKMEGEGVKQLSGLISQKRVVIQPHKLQPGIYIVYVKIDFDPEFQPDFDVNLAVYADHPCTIDLASKEEATKMRRGQDIPWDGIQRKKSEQYPTFKAKAGSQPQQIKKEIQPSEEEKKKSAPQSLLTYSKSEGLATVGSDGKKKVKKVRKIEYKTTKIQYITETKKGEKNVRTNTKQLTKEVLEQKLESGVSIKTKAQQKVVNGEQNFLHGESQQKVEQFQEKVQVSLQKPNGEIITKIERNQGKMEIVQEEGEQQGVEDLPQVENASEKYTESVQESLVNDSDTEENEENEQNEKKFQQFKKKMQKSEGNSIHNILVAKEDAIKEKVVNIEQQKQKKAEQKKREEEQKKDEEKSEKKENSKI